MQVNSLLRYSNILSVCYSGSSSQNVHLSSELGIAILQTQQVIYHCMIYAVHITYDHKKHLNPHKGYISVNGSSKGNTKIAALNDSTGLVYLKLFGIKQVLEDHNPLRLDSLWALHIRFSPV